MAKDSLSGKSTAKVDDANSAEIVEILPHLIAVDAKKLPTHAFSEVETWEDAIQLAQETFGHLVSAEELGDGTELVNKDTLVDIPLLVMECSFHLSTKGRIGEDKFYTTVRGITKDNRKFVFSDGSTGVCQQLAFLADKHNRKGGFYVAGGLVRSDYTVKLTDPKTGEEYDSEATTYYLSTVKA